MGGVQTCWDGFFTREACCEGRPQLPEARRVMTSPIPCCFVKAGGVVSSSAPEAGLQSRLLASAGGLLGAPETSDLGTSAMKLLHLEKR